MRRAERLFEIVQILRRSNAPTTARDIAEELETSVRSVYRDIAALTAQRVPIRGEAGVGYILEDGFDMPPLMLTAEEVDAAVLGALWVASRAEPELAKAAENLIAKIKAIAPDPLLPHIVQPPTSVSPTDGETGDGVESAQLRKAIVQRNKVRIEYTDGGGNASTRTVWPVLLGYRDVGRILAAWCELREGFRYFRTDRMLSAQVLDERYPERRDRLFAQWKDAMDKERERYSSVEIP